MKQLYEDNDEDMIFQADITELYSLFDPDNINDNISYQKFQNLNGVIGLQSQLKTHIINGINDKELSETIARRKYFGSNEPYRKEMATLVDMIKECFEDTMLQILCVATIVSTTIGIIQNGINTGWMEGAAILLAVILIVSVSSGNNYIKELQFRKLNEKIEEMFVNVTRDKNILLLDNKELLVGDLLTLSIGDLLQVDGILVEGYELRMDESSITGESDTILKIAGQKMQNQNESCFILSGSKVMDGVGKMIVCSVGENTQLGQLRRRLQETDDPTPLQQKLESIAEDIGYVGTVSAALTMVALWIHLGIDIYFGNICALCTESLQELINSFMIAVTIIVVAVPEGLPLAVTISLAFGLTRMKDENNLVKTLGACETMGGCTTICSDKTGTITQNIMQVQKLYMQDQLINAQQIHQGKIDSQINQIFCQSVCINSTANPKVKNNKWEQIGNKTECALIELSYKLGTNYEQFRQNTQNIIKVIPFNSLRKKMTLIWQLNAQQLRIFVKGAPEIILEKCIQLQIENSGVIPLDKNKKSWIISKVISQYSTSALRTIALAYKDIDISQSFKNLNDDFIESDLTLIAIAGIRDPVRPEIQEAVKKVRAAGVTIRMVTGDNMETAIAIAKECLILEPNISLTDKGSFEVMEGKKFRQLVGGLVYENPYGKNFTEMGKSSVQNMDMFRTIMKELKVLARSTPEDKYLLVTGLKQMEEVVAVTGDGTNDAPALKKADIGFAMGIAGSEVAKDAASIIILDDNFASIVTSIKWGRNIYDSVRKFIQFQLTVNIVALFMSLMGAIVLKKSPLNAIEMLWVNMVMDTFASLALATESPNDNLLQRKPYKRMESMVTPNMWRNIICQAIYQIIILSLILFKIPAWLNIPSSFDMVTYSQEQAVHFTIFFQAFVMMQVFNEINARKLERDEINVFAGICDNWMFWFVIIITIVVQYSLVQFGGKYVGIAPLNLFQHALCFGVGFFSLVIGLIIKLFPNLLFNKISIFREQELEDMDNSFTSKMRRKSSIRLGSHVVKSQSESQLKLKSIDRNKITISINSGHS